MVTERALRVMNWIICNDFWSKVLIFFSHINTFSLDHIVASALIYAVLSYFSSFLTCSVVACNLCILSGHMLFDPSPWFCDYNLSMNIFTSFTWYILNNCLYNTLNTHCIIISPNLQTIPPISFSSTPKSATPNQKTIVNIYIQYQSKVWIHFLIHVNGEVCPCLTGILHT